MIDEGYNLIEKDENMLGEIIVYTENGNTISYSTNDLNDGSQQLSFVNKLFRKNERIMYFAIIQNVSNEISYCLNDSLGLKILSLSFSHYSICFLLKDSDKNYVFHLECITQYTKQQKSLLLYYC